VRRRVQESRVVFQAASGCLDYPEASLLARLPHLRAALAEQPDTTAVCAITRLVEHIAATPLDDQQRTYVETFDLDGKHALYLSYWTDGNTRRRGEVLGHFKAAYRASGWLVDTGGELPDYLPMVLEFAAVADPDAGRTLLTEFRPSLELLRLGLTDAATPYADGVIAVCETLPGPSPKDRSAVAAMAGGPPTEQVGLEPYDPRLLPLQPAGPHG
jgi:nitrate reductase molybdenum cofactor assembly chaperone NarJ/NarW